MKSKRTPFTLILVTTCIFAALGLFADKTPIAISKHFNVDKQGLALNGYDPVSYHKGEPQSGDPRFQLDYQGVKFWFSSEQNQKEFLRKPEKYLPAFGGWCAYAFGLGTDKVEVDPKAYLIVNGKLHLFYRDFFTDTKKLWLEKESELKPKAAENWQKLITRE
ncbi:MAG: YHS domain-containing (seleno)protein [Leptospira sp.]|nr:YHS domain-containing (seleno)protein [Leptospira sp.]